MKKIICTILLFAFYTNTFAQDYFEGQIDFKVEYESLNINIPSSYLSYVLGDLFTAYVQEDRYIILYNSKADKGWSKTIISLDEGYSYVEFEKSDTIFKSKLNSNKNKLIMIKKNPNKQISVLGELCSSISLKYESIDSENPIKISNGVHYYNPKYRLNPEKYRIYTSGFWNLYVDKSEAISIRSEHIYEGFFKSVSEAKKIELKEIPDELFELNKEKIIVDSN